MTFRFAFCPILFSALVPMVAWAQAPQAAPAPTLAVKPVAPIPAPVVETPDEPGVIWAPAATGNFRPSNRPAAPTDPKNGTGVVDRVIIHDIEGSAEGAVNWFQNPKSGVSAHYVVDAVRGRIWQQVKERDIGYHAGNWNINTRSIGIEHEGFAYRPGFYTTTLYETSARLVRDITNRYQIPRDRTHIIGHFEVPNASDPTKFGGSNGHTDPGPYWDWDYYMVLVRNDARPEGTPPSLLVLHPGEKASVILSFTNTGDDAWPAQTCAVQDVALQTSGPVYVGTASGQPSPLTGTAWASPRFAATAPNAIAPGATGTFTLGLQGPSFAATPSVVVDVLRLTKVLPAPHLPVPFGPAVSVSAQIVPWDLAFQDGGTGLAGQPAPTVTAPGWATKNVNGHRAFEAKNPQTPLEFRGTLPLAGTWEVYARYAPGRDRTQKAVYEILTATGPVRVTLDQREGVAKDGWKLLGRFDLLDPKAVSVRFISESGGTVSADALRFVGPVAPAPPPPATLN